MHDDQHGTAVISTAAMLNAVKIAGKTLDKLRVVVNGAGAAAIACARLFIAVGVRHLPGKDGLIALLLEKGYQVEPIGL